MKGGGCRICGGRNFVQYDVLWPELIKDWELSEDEVKYINIQQGYCCTLCGNNLRSIALAHAIIQKLGGRGILSDIVFEESVRSIKLLEINEAGGLSPYLSKMPCHQLAQYPEYDMMDLNLPDNKFDLVVHSDTLEHVPYPVRALSECYRVLHDSGTCLFTVPILVDKLSRSRRDLKNSFHGNDNTTSLDFLVHSEFGADIWSYAMKAGFECVEMQAFQYPSAIVVSAKK